MKQNYAISLALLAASAFAGNASTYNLNFHCENHSDQVAISVQTSTQDSSGNWTVAEGTSYTFGEDKDVAVPYDSDQSPTIHVLIIDPDGDSEYYIDDISVEGSGGAWKANGNKDWQVYAYSSGVDVNYNIVVTSDAEKYTDTLYLKVDDLSSANLSFATSYRSIDSSKLVAGEYTPILFNLESDGELLINNTNYQKSFYKVLINDVDKTNDYNYGIAVAANDRVEILYTFPDVKCNITFKYATEESKGCVKKVTVDGVVPEDLTEDGFTVQMGSTAVITVDDEWYKLTNMTLNGVAPSYVYSPYTINKILEDTEIEFTATLYDTFDVTVNIDTPKNVKVYRGNSYNGTRLEVAEGENRIKLSSNNTMLSIAPKSGVTIESIKDADENELYPTSTWDTAATFYSVKEGDVYTVTTSAMERNNVFVLYVDDPTIPANGYNFSRGNDRSYLNEDADQGKVPAGYSMFYFGDSVSDEATYTVGENVFTFACYDSNYHNNPDKPRNLYVNDEKVEPVYQGSASWEVTLSDKDVVKLYLASNPELAEVSFDVPEDVEVSVVKDLITEASTEGFNAFPGTQVDLTFSSNGNGYDVYLNDEKVEVSEDAYSFNVAGDTVVKVALASENGVSSVSADSSINNIYNLQGIKVGTNRNQLPAGIYIINGRKVAVK
jgi:hypothetical protein